MISDPTRPKTLFQKLLSVVSFFVFLTVLTVIFGVANTIFANASLESLKAWTPPFLAAFSILLCWVILRMQIKRERGIKYHFLTTAAHQFRTPLTRIQWTLSSLSSEMQTDKQQALLLSLKQMITELIKGANQLLDATEAGGNESLYYDYLFEERNLSAPALRAIEAYMPGVYGKNITLVTDIRQGLPPVRIDRDRIEQAIAILLENAIVYTRQGGEIEVKIYQDGGNIVFSIRDSGIGIPKNMLPYLFTSFFRTKEAVAMDADRAGLGLSIAKDIVERHGGKIFAASEGSERGSHFWFTIPVA